MLLKVRDTSIRLELPLARRASQPVGAVITLEGTRNAHATSLTTELCHAAQEAAAVVSTVRVRAAVRLTSSCSVNPRPLPSTVASEYVQHTRTSAFA
eukprot:2761390-Prymnesium_polylepis.1